MVAVSTGGVGTNTTCSLLARKENDTAQTFYRVVATIRNSGELNDVNISKTVAGATTILDTATTDWSNNDLFEISTVNTSIKGYRQGNEVVAATDGSITAGTYTGLRYFSDSASGACTVDTLNAADVGGSGALRRRHF
jgi:hypothetical protein